MSATTRTHKNIFFANTTKITEAATTTLTNLTTSTTTTTTTTSEATTSEATIANIKVDKTNVETTKCIISRSPRAKRKRRASLIPNTPAKQKRRGSAAELFCTLLTPTQLTPCAVKAAAALTAAAILHTTDASAASSVSGQHALLPSVVGLAAASGGNDYADLLLPTTRASSSRNTITTSPATNTNMSTNGTINILGDVDEGGGDGDWMDRTLLSMKTFVMLFIIVAAIFGNLLVIISVMRNRKLR